MKVTLLHYTPLWLADKAIGKCHNKPTPDEILIEYDNNKNTIFKPGCNVKRIDRIANKMKHESTIEILQYIFDIKNISTSCLLELTRHRTFSYSVQSSRYTTKQSKDTMTVSYSKNKSINEAIDKIISIVKEEIDKGASNDDLKLLLPQAYNYSLVMRCDARNLRNFLSLRTAPAAHYHIRDLAYAIYEQIPEDHKFLFKDYITKK